MIAYVLPTRNRSECLARTLAALGSLPRHQAEIIVVDNAGDPPVDAPGELASNLPVTILRRSHNEGAAGRNAGVRAADPSSKWIVMLDDDSHPRDLRFMDALAQQPSDVAAVRAEIFLSKGRREAGGLPEVPIGCGVAYRREAFLAARIGDEAGYDPSFGFYAEEYDLAARLIQSGRRIVMDRRFIVEHEKTPAGRSMEAILRRLVRNNAWVMARHAPAACRVAEVRRIIERYWGIACKEHAKLGYAAGLAELSWTFGTQQRTPLDSQGWDRFTGKAACRRGLLAAWTERRFASAAIVAPGKNEHIVRECLAEMGVRMVSDELTAEALVIGTLSPGPMLDAAETLASADGRVITPWHIEPSRANPASTLRTAA